MARNILDFPSGNGISVMPPPAGVGDPDGPPPLLASGLPPISSDPPLHTWTRRLVLPTMSPAARGRVRDLHPRPVPHPRRRFPRARRGRCCSRIRAADPRASHRPHPWRARVDVVDVHRVGARRARVRQRRRAALPRHQRHSRVPHGCARRAHRQPHRRLHQRTAAERARRRAHRALGGHGHVCPAAHRRHRHHVVVDRFVDVAPGHAPRRPSTTAGRRQGPVVHSHRRTAPCVRAGHHGSAPLARRRVQRLPDEGRRPHPDELPGREPRPRAVPRARQGHPRPREQPARRVRSRHPPLRRLEPGAHGTAGGHRGVHHPHPRVRAEGPALVTWAGGQVRGPRNIPVVF